MLEQVPSMHSCLTRVQGMPCSRHLQAVKAARSTDKAFCNMKCCWGSTMQWPQVSQGDNVGR